MSANEKLGEFPALLRNADDDRDVLYIQQNLGGQLSRPALYQGGVMQLGLVCDRGSKLSAIDNIFITHEIIDLHLVGSGSHVFPLYVKTKEA